MAYVISLSPRRVSSEHNKSESAAGKEDNLLSLWETYKEAPVQQRHACQPTPTALRKLVQLAVAKPDHREAAWLVLLLSDTSPEAAQAALDASLASVRQTGNASATMQADVAAHQPALYDSRDTGSSKPDGGAVQLLGRLRDQVHLILASISIQAWIALAVLSVSCLAARPD